MGCQSSGRELLEMAIRKANFQLQMKQICSVVDMEPCDDSVTTSFSGAKLALENGFIGSFLVVLLAMRY